MAEIVPGRLYALIAARLGAGALPAPVVRVEAITRYSSAGTRTVGAGKVSYSVTVVAGNYPTSPTLGGVPLPVGVHNYSAPDVDTLTGLSLVTVSGDDVIVRSV